MAGKKWGYYHVDCGHFPVQIKLCFSNDTFQKILQDHGINVRATALDYGVAETHYLSDGKEGIIVMVFDMDDLDVMGPEYLAGTIAHEATHCVTRVFEHIGEDKVDIGDESRAYLVEHIVRQLTRGVEMHREKLIGKRHRKVPRVEGGAGGRDVPEVDEHGDGGAGPNSAPEE